jgi:hypothetical protein
VGEAIGSIVGLAAAVAVSPFPIVAMILLLATKHALTAGLAYGLGWLVGLSGLGALVLLISGPADAGSSAGPADWVGWLKLALGILLLFYGLAQWRRWLRQHGEQPAPRWMASIDSFSPARSAGLGAVLAAINPKNAALTVAAATSISSTGVSAGGQVVALAVFVIIGSVGVLAPLAVYVIAGARAAQVLASWRVWFVANNAVVMSVLFFVLGLKLLGDGIEIVG